MSVLLFCSKLAIDTSFVVKETALNVCQRIDAQGRGVGAAQDSTNGLCHHSVEAS